MPLFRRSAAKDEDGGEEVKALTAQRDEALRALGEIYYETSRNGELDTRALERKMREIGRLDKQLEASRPSRAGKADPRALVPPCRKCGAVVTERDRFCLRCGAPTVGRNTPTRPCPACNQPVDDGARFCNSCGATMASPGTIRIRHPLTGQEASFDFQPVPQPVPAPPPQEVACPPYAFDEQDEEEVDESGERGWVRELERFARQPQVDAHVFLQRGLDFLKNDRFREAAAEFEAALLANPRDARASYGLGVARFHGGDLDAAIEAFLRCIRLDRRSADAHNDLGLCHARKNESREALDAYERALQIEPAHADAHFNLAQLLMNQMAYADAIRHLQMYLKSNPRAPDFKHVTEMIDQLQHALKTGVRAKATLPPR